MRIDDKACLARGFVNPSFVDIATGRRLPFRMRHNTLSFMSAEAMAAAFGGDPSYIPARMGFIYGNQQAMPTESVITRSQDWDSLLEELASSEGRDDVDIQVVGFSFHPTLGAAKPFPVRPVRIPDRIPDRIPEAIQAKATTITSCQPGRTQSPSTRCRTRRIPVSSGRVRSRAEATSIRLSFLPTMAESTMSCHACRSRRGTHISRSRADSR